MRRALLTLCLALATFVVAGPAAAAGPERPLFLADKDEVVNEGLDPAPADADRSTPARAWRLLSQGCQRGRPEQVVHVLNLGDVPAADRVALAPKLAVQLCAVLKVADRLEAPGLDDSPLGPSVIPADGPSKEPRPANYVVARTLPVGGGEEELWLRRFHDTRGDTYVWLLTRQTVSKIPSWHQALVTRDRAARPGVEALHAGLGPRPAKLHPGNPREALTSFAALCRAGDRAQAAYLLDLSGVEKDRQAEEGPRLARRLGLLLDRLRPSGFASVSNDPAGAPEQDVQVDEEVVARATLVDHEQKLKLTRYPSASGAPAWLVSADTVSVIDEVYDQLGYGFAGDYLPAFFFAWRALGVQLWQWLGLLLGLVVALVLGMTVSWLARAIFGRVATRTSWAWDDELIAALNGPLAIGFGVVAFLALAELLSLGEGPRQSVLTGSKLTAILAGGWLLLRLVDVAGNALTQFFKGRHDDLATAMVPVFRRVLKPIAGVLVGVVALQNLGLNVAGLLAGLGIGGLALALAGKPTLENLFGSLAIAFDRPFKIGEFVKVDTFLGTIEDVGLRSTRIRTLDRTLVSIPNAQMADAKVENFARRDRFRVYAMLGLEYGTSMEQMKLVLDDLKKLLLAHPQVWQESFQVRFVGYGASALNVEIYFWVLAPNFDLFTGVREALLLEMGRVIEKAGARFAFPSQTVYQAEVAPADPRFAEQARAEIEKRTQAGVLCVPEIVPAVRDAARPPEPEKKA